MSVINKMLRDLDARRAEGAVPGLARQTVSSGMQGTISVPSSASSSVSRLARWVLVLVLLLAAGITAAWYLGLGLVSPPPAAPLVTIVEPAASAPVPGASAPEPAASAPAPTTGTRIEMRPTAKSVPSAPRENQHGRQSEAAATGAPAGQVKDRKEQKLAASAAGARAPGAAPTATHAGATLPALASSVPLENTRPQHRHTAAQETLAQAQALWNAGSREGALDLIREAVGVVERTQPVDVALLSQLVREQARMELTLGRPGAVLSLLGRLEPVLSGQADLWAVRGNAAQRLGRHQEAVQAYGMALQLRPGEPRWMLGAAVSLAALGQLDAAAQQAEQARALGPVSPEVLTYLRQAGVPLR